MLISLFSTTWTVMSRVVPEDCMKFYQHRWDLTVKWLELAMKVDGCGPNRCWLLINQGRYLKTTGDAHRALISSSWSEPMPGDIRWDLTHYLRGCWIINHHQHISCNRRKTMTLTQSEWCMKRGWSFFEWGILHGFAPMLHSWRLGCTRKYDMQQSPAVQWDSLVYSLFQPDYCMNCVLSKRQLASITCL